MLHVCDQRFDVTENFENFCEFPKRPKAARTEPGWGICREPNAFLLDMVFIAFKTQTKFLCVFTSRIIYLTKALFSSKNFYKIGTVALSFVFDKNCLIMD